MKYNKGDEGATAKRGTQYHHLHRRRRRRRLRSHGGGVIETFPSLLSIIRRPIFHPSGTERHNRLQFAEEKETEKFVGVRDV